MPPNDHTIRVTGRGEFGELRRNLKGLQRDLTDVSGVIDKGARKGGFFDQNQMRALDIYQKRFQQSMQAVNKEFERQNNAIEALHAKRKKLDQVERFGVDEEIKRREKVLDQLRRQLMYMEQLHQSRSGEASGFKSPGFLGKMFGGGSGGALSGGAMLGLGGMLGRVPLVGKFLAGLAGMVSVMSILFEAYDIAKERQIGSLDLSQRLRGFGGRRGSAVDMYDTASAIGRRDMMGYTQKETWDFLDAYSSRGGALTEEQQYRMQRFARGYGLDLTGVGAIAGRAKQIGATGTPDAFTNMMAGSATYSGMVPRITEVMETAVQLLESIDTTLEDGAATNILGIQALLDRIGMQNGMTKLTGAQGARVIQGLAGIFNPSEGNNWRWLGMSALQSYNPKKYGSMDYFGLTEAFEEGAANPENIPAMAKYLKKSVGGNDKMAIAMLQKWLQQGGYNASYGQARKLYEVTGGMEGGVFNQAAVDAVMNDIKNGADPYGERIKQWGQHLLDVEARWKKMLESVGDVMLKSATGVKDIVVSTYEWLDIRAKAFMDKIEAWFDKILKKLGIDPAGEKKAREQINSPVNSPGANWPMSPGAYYSGTPGGLSFFNGWRGNIPGGGRFGDSRDGGSRRHQGIDLPGDEGTPLASLVTGEVDVQPFDSDNPTPGGNQLVIYELDQNGKRTGRAFLYSHMNDYAPGLQSGQIVKRGDIVGTMGTTGYYGKGSVGSHLHLGITDYDGNWINPEDALDEVLSSGNDSTLSLKRFGSRGGSITSIEGAISSLTSALSGFNIPSEIKLAVQVNIGGEAAPMLNTRTVDQLEAIIRQVVEEIASQNLKLVPTVAS